ncbi:alanine racemase [Synechococcus sp. RSCCF101]|uniref:alanine racemase n=1 Tax=Synechococcus sp. RSCCF101 TaxID=2511069 RepID=UPI001245723B|nr:alanine racemase [Synechococcus sp. RSCCF101]QEY32200.1 alanine racemase [Synechococcus sp. RSCCF101]
MRHPDDGAELDPRQRAWVDVEADAIRSNVRLIRSEQLGHATRLMAVVKADGYGHGALAVARAAAEGGACQFGVATLAEGIELRRGGIEAPVLVLGNLIDAASLAQCVRWNLMPTLSDPDQARHCHDLARAGGRRLAVHLKVDTGMSRLGVPLGDALPLAEAIQELEGLELAGVYSHLAMADGPPDGRADAVTRRQQEAFRGLLASLQDREIRCGLRHLANSAGTLRDRALHHDLVRVGLALYGHSPSGHLATPGGLRPALHLRARVTLVRSIGAGVGVSYGHHFISSRPMRLAVVAIGYADGVPRLLSGRMEVLHRGRSLPQVGAITMDQLMIDASGCPDLQAGDTVTLLGSSGAAVLSPAEWSDQCGTIPWEILCGFKHRLPRLPAAAPEAVECGQH